MAQTQKILTFVSKASECQQQKCDQHAPSLKTECDSLYGWIRSGHIGKYLAPWWRRGWGGGLGVVGWVGIVVVDGEWRKIFSLRNDHQTDGSMNCFAFTLAVSAKLSLCL